MVDALDVLLDDRPLVEVGRHVVRGRADQLHAAVVRLVVRLRALEAGQEAVVDVDRAALQEGAELGAQDLHVARQHDQVDLPVAHQRLDLLLLCALGLGRRAGGEREMVERDAVAGGQPGEVGVVRDDPSDVDVELPEWARNSRSFRQWPCLLTISSRRALRVSEWKVASMPKRSRTCVNSPSSVPGAARCAGALEVHPHEEEQPRAVVALHVAELLRVDDVAAGLVEQAGDSVDDALAVGAGQGQDEFVGGIHRGAHCTERLPAASRYTVPQYGHLPSPWRRRR